MRWASTRKREGPGGRSLSSPQRPSSVAEPTSAIRGDAAHVSYPRRGRDQENVVGEHLLADCRLADGVPEVAQARRLGHILGNRIQETYSHVAAEVDTRLLEGLQDRWDKAVADSPLRSAWRETGT